ncbi:MAG: dienelactone hydrolase family protein [Acidimicrobiales bacterium]|nr:dienelactone hydrolase family protein [Acidimicrobiales bacterium]
MSNDQPDVVADDVVVNAGAVDLPGFLAVPADARGLVVFAHGSGSSRHSPRNRQVADVLERAGFATLLFDLLTADEAQDRANVFDVGLLADRLVNVEHWTRAQPSLAALPTGFFGASTGACAALGAAAMAPSNVFAVVSRGGRPDLAGELLPQVEAPTLLLVGEKDETVLELNRTAQERLRCRSHLEVIPGAGHLFEEPGALTAVAEAARDWFVDELAQSSPS